MRQEPLPGIGVWPDENFSTLVHALVEGPEEHWAGGVGHLSTYLFIYLFVYLFIYLFIIYNYLYIYIYTYMYIYMEVP